VLKTGSGSGVPTLLQQIVHTAAGAVTAGTRLPAIPMDYDGDSMFLGAPIHIVAEQVVRTDFILEEPPKHAYWDQDAKQVVNVSRYDDFNISLYDSTGQEFSSNTKDTLGAAIGASVSMSAAGTV
jgi:hypothetical protein